VKRRVCSRGGIALIITLLVLLLLMVVAGGLIASGTATLQLSGADANGVQAQYAAQAGLMYGVDALNRSWDWTTGWTQSPLPHATNSDNSVQVTNNIRGTTSVSASDGTLVDPGAAYVQASGRAGALRGAGAVNQQASGSVMVVGRQTVVGVFGMSSVSLTDTSLFNDMPPTGSGASLIQTLPSVATNSIVNGALTLAGSGNIAGNVDGGPIPSPTPTPAPAPVNILGSVVVSGKVGDLGSLYAPPAFTVAAGGANLNYSGGTVTVPAGTYGDLIATNTTLNFSGTYNFDTVVLTNCSVNCTDRAYATWLYANDATLSQCMGGTALQYPVPMAVANNVRIQNSTVHVVVDAPTATVTLGPNAIIYGEIIGNSVVSTGVTEVHVTQNDVLGGASNAGVGLAISHDVKVLGWGR
jgi:hypothetical protein